MELIRGTHNLRARHRGSVLTLGNFDGVHLGHRRILERLRREADQRGLRATVMLFEPQPREWFDGAKAPPRLMHLRDKLLTLSQLGVDQVLCLRFDDRFRTQRAAEFVEQLLVQGLAVDFLVVGDDFRFGRGREGDFAYLQQAGKQFGFAVEDTPTCELDGERVSSTRVREVLRVGDLELAARLLGQPFHISGRVRHGDHLGRTLGAPTANLAVGRRQSPLSGVYAVQVHGVADAPYNAVANIGHRPTVGGQEMRLEVHLLDFKGDLYGCHLRVDFLHFLRPELKFDGLAALQTAIHQDFDQARAWFERQKATSR